MAITPFGSFSVTFANLATKISGQAAAVKGYFDSIGNDIKTYINDTLIPALNEHLADDVRHINYAIDTGAANAYVVTLSPAPSAYVAGMMVCFKASNLNTGAATLNCNNLGAKSIKKKGISGATATLVDLLGADIQAGDIVTAIYDGEKFITDLGLRTHGLKIAHVRTATRDISITGTQTISGLLFKPKWIQIMGYVPGTLKNSEGIWSEDSQYGKTVYQENGFTYSTTYCCDIADSGSQYAIAQITNITDSSFDIAWTKVGTPTGTAQLRFLIGGHQ